MEKIWEALMDGAPWSFVNLAVLAFVLAIIAERAVYILTKYRVNSREFMAQIRKLVQAGNIDRADADDHPAAAVAVEHTVIELLPDALWVDRVFADQQTPQEGIRPIQHRARHPRRNGEDLRDARDTLVRMHTHKGQPVNARHVRVVVGLWVTQDKDLDVDNLHGLIFMG